MTHQASPVCLFCSEAVRIFWLPGAESVLPHPLLLQQTSVLQFDRAGDEAHLAALLHQTSDPPVVVVLLHADRQNFSLGIRPAASNFLLHVRTKVAQKFIF